MHKALIVVVAALCLYGFAGQAWAQMETDTITVSVSLADVVGVLVDPDTWNIGPVALGQMITPYETYSANNVGTVMIDLTVSATDGANGWVIGPSPATDTFALLVDSVQVSTSPVSLYPALPASSGFLMNLIYWSPTGDTQGGGVGHDFTITFSATRSP